MRNVKASLVGVFWSGRFGESRNNINFNISMLWKLLMTHIRLVVGNRGGGGVRGSHNRRESKLACMAGVDIKRCHHHPSTFLFTKCAMKSSVESLINSCESCQGIQWLWISSVFFFKSLFPQAWQRMGKTGSTSKSWFLITLQHRVQAINLLSRRKEGGYKKERKKNKVTQENTGRVTQKHVIQDFPVWRLERPEWIYLAHGVSRLGYIFFEEKIGKGQTTHHGHGIFECDRKWGARLE